MYLRIHLWLIVSEYIKAVWIIKEIKLFSIKTGQDWQLDVWLLISINSIDHLTIETLDSSSQKWRFLVSADGCKAGGKWSVINAAAFQ